MTAGDGTVWIWSVIGISAIGSLFACRRWSSRLAFFLMAPPIYLLLWMPITVVSGLLLLPFGEQLAYTLGTAATLGLYILNCVILHNDGVGGVSLVEGLGETGPGGREKGGGGDGGTTPPPPITYRRMALK